MADYSSPAVKGLQETSLSKHSCHKRGLTVCALLQKNSGSLKLLNGDYSVFANLLERQCFPIPPASFRYSTEYLDLPVLTLYCRQERRQELFFSVGRKEDKSWDTKGCFKSSKLSYSLGKIQGWVLANAEALDTCFWTISRLQAWVEATTFAFSVSCDSEMCNSAFRHPEFIFSNISFHIRMNSIFKTQILYCTFLLHLNFTSKLNISDENRASYTFLSHNLVIHFDRTEKTVLKYITCTTAKPA